MINRVVLWPISLQGLLHGLVLPQQIQCFRHRHLGHPTPSLDLSVKRHLWCLLVQSPILPLELFTYLRIYAKEEFFLLEVMQKCFIHAISNFIQINYNLLIFRKRSLSDNGNIFLFGGGYETQHFHLTISKIFVILNEILYYFVKVVILNQRQLCLQLYHKLIQKLEKGWKLRIADRLWNNVLIS